MIITRTPYRISFVGGGSDLPSFSSKYGGAVLSTSINKYMYITAHPYFNRSKILLRYSKTEEVPSVQDIQHPIIREVFSHIGCGTGIDISSTGDVPSGTGLGSSSAFSVGLLHALYAMKLKLVTKDQLAREASMIEIERVKSPIGKQDQYASAFGGMNVLSFERDGETKVAPVIMSSAVRKELQQNLLLLYTKQQRDANTILSEQNKLLSEDRKTDVLLKMVELVPQLRDALVSGDLTSFGELLHKNWLLKRSITTGISDARIDHLYELALKNGALGGKLLGAGGGGFLLLYCPREKQELLRMALSDLDELKFKFEHDGTKLLYFTEGSSQFKGFFDE